MDRKYNDQKKIDRRKNNDLQNITLASKTISTKNRGELEYPGRFSSSCPTMSKSKWLCFSLKTVLIATYYACPKKGPEFPTL